MSITEPSGSEPANITNQIRQRQNETNGVAVSSPSGRDATEYVRQNLDNQESPGVGVPGCSCCTESNKSPQRLEIPDFEPNRKRPRVSNSTGQDNARPPLINNTKSRATKNNQKSVSVPEKLVKKVVKKCRKLPKISTWAGNQVSLELEALLDEDKQDLEKIGRTEKWAMLSALRDLTPWHRVTSCCRITLPSNVNGVEGVQLLQRPKCCGQKASARFGNLGQCGSVWICPICAPKIARQRSDELNRALTRHIEEGGVLMHVTLTHRHKRDDVLSTQLAKQGAAFQSMHRHRKYRELCDANGVIGSVKALELTHSDANGWHVHVHLLLLLAGDGKQAKRHAEHMTKIAAKRANHSGKAREPVEPARVSKLMGFGREYIRLWREHAKKQGLFASWDAQKAEIAASDEKSIEKLSDYLTKTDADGKNYDNLDAFDGSRDDFEAAAENVWNANTTNSKGGSDAGKELSMGALKLARGKSKTPMQYLREYTLRGDNYAGALFAEFAAAIHGRAALTWSRGLKEFYDVATLSDEEIAAKEERAQQAGEVLVGELSRYEWTAVLCGPRLARAHLLEMAKNLDTEGITRYLSTLISLFERRRATGPP